jgi:integrase
MSSHPFQELRLRYHTYMSAKPSYPQMRRLFRVWIDRLPASPTTPEIRARHQTQSRTPVQANKELMLLRAMFNWGIVEGCWTGENPARGIKAYRVYSREVVMSERELVRLRDSLPVASPKYRAYFGLLLLTGCRMSEARTMRWTDLGEDGRWHKPTTKNGRPHLVPIPAQALAWIRDVPNQGSYIFMGLYGHPLSRAAAEKAWGSWRSAIGLDRIWLHDFRRTLMSYLYTILKADELTVKAVLNHYDNRPVAVYVRLNADYLATVLDGYAAWLSSLPPEGGSHVDTSTLDHVPAVPRRDGPRPVV